MNSIEATHAHKLPGVRCPNCGAWAKTGVIYPCVDESALNEKSLPSVPLSVDQFRSLAAELKPVLGSERPVFPGTGLGPLRGRAKGGVEILRGRIRGRRSCASLCGNHSTRRALNSVRFVPSLGSKINPMSQFSSWRHILVLSWQTGWNLRLVKYADAAGCLCPIGLRSTRLRLTNESSTTSVELAHHFNR